jgi:hypothetical protein
MQIGSKVVCIDDSFPEEIEKIYTELPKKDEIYTVRDMILGKNFNGEEGEVAILLNEISNPMMEELSIHEPAFKQERFREVEPPKAKEEELLEEIAI